MENEKFFCCCDDTPMFPQRHDHEIVGSVKIAEANKDPHNHRFATVSGQAILLPNGQHIHEIEFITDFYEDHLHTFKGQSGIAIDVGNNRHVHFINSQTTVVDGHFHEFQVAVLINNPIGE